LLIFRNKKTAGREQNPAVVNGYPIAIGEVEIRYYSNNFKMLAPEIAE